MLDDSQRNEKPNSMVMSCRDYSQLSFSIYIRISPVPDSSPTCCVEAHTCRFPRLKISHLSLPLNDTPTNGRLRKPLGPRQVECFQRLANLNIMHLMQTLAIELKRIGFFPKLVT